MKELAIVLGALIAAVLVAGAIVFAFRPAEDRGAPVNAAATSTTAVALPQLASASIIAEEQEAVAAELGRAVPADILKTATVSAAPFNPGIKLKRTLLESDEWEGRRASIEDRATRDVRVYAIGDLLPYGSLLVGISTASIDVMVSDAYLVRIYENGKIKSLHDLSSVYEPSALPIVKNAEPPDADVVRLALIDLRNDDPTVVQAAIDTLISAGDPSIELLVPHVADVIPVRSAEYAFPSGSAIEMRPRVSGELVMMILGRITGQTFGDLAKEDLSDEERRTIARAWQRFFE